MFIQDQIKALLVKLPYVKKLYQQVTAYNKNSCYPPGHFYSPIVDVSRIKRNERQVWKNPIPDHLPGIDLNYEMQEKLTKHFYAYYPDCLLPSAPSENFHYYSENDFFGFTDAFVLQCMIRHFAPRKIIEIGSGFSSAVMLDTRHSYGKELALSFIEPYPDRLNTLLRENDKASVRIFCKEVQEVALDEFASLEAGDFLFIDSTHVSKTGSDVNYIFFEIIPSLKPGVFIHFHDIFYPFEYPREWVYEGRGWNENYMLRNFLSYNRPFSIVYFAHYLFTKHGDLFNEMPKCKASVPGSIWIQKS